MCFGMDGARTERRTQGGKPGRVGVFQIREFRSGIERVPCSHILVQAKD